MVIAIASGKGGTGKTTVAVNLAVVWRAAGRRVTLLDGDVEEPNAHLFLAPTFDHDSRVTVPVPSVDSARCRHCGACARLCQFGAIMCTADRVVVFPELCHSCGGCALVCPNQAISEIPREVGVIQSGRADGVTFGHGRLHVGEARAVPVISRLKDAIPESGITLIDAPPGSSCPMIAAVKGSDFVCLVTEPTPFGLSDLKMAVEAVNVLGIAMGVIINRVGIGDDRVKAYCREEGLPVLGEIQNDRRLAEAYSRGEVAVRVLPNVRAEFDALANSIERCAHSCTN